jgi:hypothetical protein
MARDVPSTVDDQTLDLDRFKDLPLARQVDFILHRPPKERLRLVFLSEHPKSLVQSLPELDLFLTVKALGDRDVVDLISLTTAEQLQYLLDLDLWKKDQLDSEKISHWVSLLLECGEERVLQFIRETDQEVIVQMLKKVLFVIKMEGDRTEQMDRTILFTLDQEYWVAFRKPETRPVLQRFLEYLYLADPVRYPMILESLISEIESELEEDAYRLRKGRMADHGFPDFEEALEIYRFVNPDSLKSNLGETPAAPSQGGAVATNKERLLARPRVGERAVPPSSLTLAFGGEGPFFSAILSLVEDPSEQARLGREIAALYNKAIIAEPIDEFTLDEMKRIGERMFHTLNLGLEYTSQKDGPKGLEILRSIPIERIFQAGVGVTILLKRKAEKILKGPWFQGDRENLAFQDPPHREWFEGVLRKRPVLCRDGFEHDFENLQDFEETSRFLSRVEAWVSFLGEKLKILPPQIKGLDLGSCHPGTWREITLSTLFLTSLAHQVLDGEFLFRAMDQSRVKEFIAQVFDKDEHGKGVVKMEIKNGLKEWFDSIESDEEKRLHFMAFRDFCCDLLENEYGKIPEGEEIDPRFVRGLLICQS